ncbi:phage NrS-1 polymerase family protein [Haloprofundus halophilus]|uniref:phage NrS-1 polymerase family protein n=1 Tax=Haloprofundus halophilus TaxID=2283527 RepID=UPI003743F054
MTGNHVLTTPEQIRERSRAIRSVHSDFVADSGSTRSGRRPTTQSRELSFTSKLDDEEILQRAQSAANSEKFSRLWNGDISGYDSHSEADMALCCLLAFWAGGDSSQVDRLFRQSGLVREKWDEVHYADGATYGEMTVERACTRVTDGYSS